MTFHFSYNEESSRDVEKVLGACTKVFQKDLIFD